MESSKDSFRWVIAFMWFCIVFFTSMALFCMPPLFSEIGKDIPLTKAQMGIVFGATPLTSLFLAFIAGSVSDRFGSRWVVGGSIVVIAVAGGFRAIAGSAVELIGYSFLMGAGMAISGPNIPKVLGAWFPREELGKANGIVLSAIPLGGALTIATAADVLSPAFGGWRGVVLAVGGICLAISLLWVILYREKKGDRSHEKTDRSILNNFGQVLKVRDVWLVALFFGFYFAACGTITGLLPIILAENGVARPGMYVSIFMGVGILVTPLSGMASDRIGKRKPFLILGAIVMAICFPLLIKAQGWALVLTMFVMGTAAASVVPFKTAIPAEMDEIGTALAATTFGFMMMVGYAMGFVGPVVSGWVTDMSGSSFSAFILMAIIMIVAAGVVTPMKETGKKVTVL